MKIFSLFSGIGGFDCAFERQGHEVVGHSEIDKYAEQIYKKHFNNKNYGDITTIRTEELPDFDCLVGGFPCQAFSIAGNRLGFEDTRGTLIYEVIRLLRDKRPKHFILENVKGLLSNDGGQTIQTIFEILTETGYDFQWKVLNSKDHGVPQNRERIYIVGHLRGEPRPEVFLEQGTSGKGIKQLNHPKMSSDRIYSPEGLSPTVKTCQGGGLQPFIKAVLTPDRANKRQNGRRMKDDGEPSFTLTSQDRHGIYDGTVIRRLTPLEFERLQGFPDGWTEGISDSQRYKCLGNAVTVNVVEYVSENLDK